MITETVPRNSCELLCWFCRPSRIEFWSLCRCIGWLSVLEFPFIFISHGTHGYFWGLLLQGAFGCLNGSACCTRGWSSLLFGTPGRSSVWVYRPSPWGMPWRPLSSAGLFLAPLAARSCSWQCLAALRRPLPLLGTLGRSCGTKRQIMNPSSGSQRSNQEPGYEPTQGGSYEPPKKGSYEPPHLGSFTVYRIIYK